MTLDETNSMHAQMTWHDWDKDDPPSFITKFKLKPDDVPHKWVKPEDSCILQIHGYEITACDTMSAGITVRFPRIARWRNDKKWWECERMRVLSTEFPL